MGLVVVTEKVQESMNNQMGEMVGKVQPLGLGFCSNGFPREHDIAERRPQPARRERRGGEGQDIGGPVLAAILAVQHPNAGIVGKDQGNLGVIGDVRQVRRLGRGERPVDQVLKFRLGGPAVGRNQNIGTDARAAGVWRQGQMPSPGVRSGLS